MTRQLVPIFSGNGGRLRPTLKLLLFVACCTLLMMRTPESHAAAGWGALMSDSPMEDFNDEDLKRHFDALYSLLNAPAPVKPVEWHNELTGSGARIELVDEPKVENFNECRRVRTSVYSKKRKALVRVWTACRTPDGNWSLVSVG